MGHRSAPRSGRLQAAAADSVRPPPLPCGVHGPTSRGRNLSFHQSRGSQERDTTNVTMMIEPTFCS